MTNLDVFIRQYENETGDKVTPNDKIHLQAMMAGHLTPSEYLKRCDETKTLLTFGEYTLLLELHSWIISKRKGNL